MKAVCFSLLLASYFCLTLADMYSAISHMEPLLETHRRVIDHLDSYIERELKRIDNLKRNVDIYRKEHELAMTDSTNFLGNPIRAFKLMNRLTNGLDLIKKSVDATADYVKEMFSIPGVSYPNEEDLMGSASAVVRVKNIYSLNITELVDEKHNGVGYPMSAYECYALSRALSDQREHRDSLALMMEALRKYSEYGDDQITQVDILEHIANMHHVLGEKEKALNVTRRILELEPQNARATSNLDIFQEAVTSAEVVKTKNLHYYEMYERMCRGEFDIARQVAKRLRCRYMHETHPFLRLAPLKQEQVYRQPDIYVFHQVMSDDEIKHIRDMATPKLSRATVLDFANHKEKIREISTYRTGKKAFLDDSELQPLLSGLSRRIQDMTGLDVTSAEELQVVDYGIGGHYGIHSDNPKRAPDRDNTSATGNRIATVLFYMTDVALGGATVFTELGLSVPPQKGSAVFWINLNPAGENDLALSHASCPVLRGSKWISTKWLHEEGQELIKPCGLQYQEEGIHWKIFPPVPKMTIKTYL